MVVAFRMLFTLLIIHLMLPNSSSFLNSPSIIVAITLHCPDVSESSRKKAHWVETTRSGTHLGNRAALDRTSDINKSANLNSVTTLQDRSGVGIDLAYTCHGQGINYSLRNEKYNFCSSQLLCFCPLVSICAAADVLCLSKIGQVPGLTTGKRRYTPIPVSGPTTSPSGVSGSTWPSPSTNAAWSNASLPSDRLVTLWK